MKKFKNEKDVVLTMTDRELGMLKLLVISGLRKMGRKKFYEDRIEEFREIYIQLV